MTVKIRILMIRNNIAIFFCPHSINGRRREESDPKDLLTQYVIQAAKELQE